MRSWNPVGQAGCRADEGLSAGAVDGVVDAGALESLKVRGTVRSGSRGLGDTGSSRSGRLRISVSMPAKHIVISHSTQARPYLRFPEQVIRDLVHNCVGEQGFDVRAARFQAQVFQHGAAGEFT